MTAGAPELARAVAEAVARISRDSLGQQIVRAEATVVAVNGDGTMDVDLGSGETPLRIDGVRMTTACEGAAPGDRVIVDTYRHVSHVVGVLSNGG